MPMLPGQLDLFNPDAPPRKVPELPAGPSATTATPAPAAPPAAAVPLGWCEKASEHPCKRCGKVGGYWGPPGSDLCSGCYYGPDAAPAASQATATPTTPDPDLISAEEYAEARRLFGQEPPVILCIFCGKPYVLASWHLEMCTGVNTAAGDERAEAALAAEERAAEEVAHVPTVAPLGQQATFRQQPEELPEREISPVATDAPAPEYSRGAREVRRGKALDWQFHCGYCQVYFAGDAELLEHDCPSAEAWRTHLEAFLFHEQRILVWRLELGRGELVELLKMVPPARTGVLRILDAGEAFTPKAALELFVERLERAVQAKPGKPRR